MDISFSIECDDWKSLDQAEAAVNRAARAAFDAAQLATHDIELSVVLSDDRSVAELNRQWRGKPDATNVLSFPAAADVAQAEGQPRFIGDIILASGVVSREACEFGKPLATHLSHLVVHGVLHLAGFDHEDDDSAERMETIETAALNLLGLPDPYEEYDKPPMPDRHCPV